MAEQVAGTDPGSRGGLVIADGVVERIATIAAGQVDGVVSVGSGLDHVLGHRYPRSTATVAGDRARLAVEVAVGWPHPLGQVCARVRDDVRSQVSGLTGITVDTVDVTAAKVVPVAVPARSRVQ